MMNRSDSKKDKKIILVEGSGFCFGVKNAIQKAKRARAELDKEIFTLGDIIHNKVVVEDLNEQGITAVGEDEIETLKRGSNIVVRSHGASRAFFEKATGLDFNLIDATCPYVSRIHTLVKNESLKGRVIIIVGNEEHPEVAGISGWCCGEKAVISENSKKSEIEEICEKYKGKGIVVVGQTTIKQEAYERVCEVIKSVNDHAEVMDTLCSITTTRQEKAFECAKNVDAMMVIGDSKSSNSLKLYEICSSVNKNTFFIENKSDLPLKKLSNCNTIGVVASASAPGQIIREVMVIMNENQNETTGNEMLELMDEIEKSMKSPKTGEIVEGVIDAINDKEIVVNLGCKKDGIIPNSEVALEEGQTIRDLFSVGDEIQAKVLKTDDGDGSILLSRRKMEASVHWAELEDALNNDETVKVDVVRAVKSGVIANYKEVSGFIPLSQLSERFIEDASEFVGQTMEAKVIRVDQKLGKAIFSPKQLQKEEKNKRLQELWKKLNVGDDIEGKVMRFTEYGAFVDIGGVDGLLHISEISWGKLKHPSEVLTVGDTINVKILSLNPEKGKISLGYKQNMPEPWSIIDDKYKAGDNVEGDIVQIKEYGAFLELEPGLDGLIHISEISHSRVENINSVLHIGDNVEAKILEIDKDRRRISLSIKALIDPPEQASEAEEKAKEEEKPADEAAPQQEVTTEEANEGVAEAEPDKEEKAE